MHQNHNQNQKNEKYKQKASKNNLKYFLAHSLVFSFFKHVIVFISIILLFCLHVEIKRIMNCKRRNKDFHLILEAAAFLAADFWRSQRASYRPISTTIYVK